MPRILVCIPIVFAFAQPLHAEDPVATIAVISNPYITALPAKDIKDERGRNRGFLANTGPASLKKAVDLVNRIKPDALVVMGSLTWTGSRGDLSAFKKQIERVNCKTFTVPGHRDRMAGLLDDYRRLLGKYHVKSPVVAVKGVRLFFGTNLHADPDAESERLRSALSPVSVSKANLLFAFNKSEFARSKLTPTHKGFNRFVKETNIAVQFEATRYGHRLGYVNQLPRWYVGSTGWSSRGAISLVRVYEKRIELAQISDPKQPAFTLTVPNPVKAPRLAAVKDDPYGCPSYSADLAKKPEFTFALVSDPQFDRQRGRETLIKKSEAAIRELNRLSPAMVFIAGDLVNNNLPEEWGLFNRVFGKLKPKQYAAPGNHDVLFNYKFIEQSYAGAPKAKPDYDKIVKRAVAAANKEGFRGPTALYEKYTGSKPQQLVEYRNSAFLIVGFLTQRIDPSQMRFLREQLKKTAKKEHVFIIAHYPTLPAFGNNVQPKLGGNAMLALLREYKVIGNLFGHRHRNGFRMHERTAHVLTDNMSTIHLFHVFNDRVIIGRKRVGVPLYEKLTLPALR